MIIHYNYMQMLICFEAYKILEYDFSEILKAYGGLKEHKAFVRDFRKVAQRAAKSHKVPIAKGTTWVETVPFGVFAKGITILYGFEADSESGKQKALALREQAETLSKEVMDEGCKSLEESASASLHIDVIALEELKPAHLRGWSENGQNRQGTEYIEMHWAIHLAQLLHKPYARLHSNSTTSALVMRSPRNIAQLGRVKLEIIEHKLSQSANTTRSTVKESNIFVNDTSDEECEASDEEAWA